MSHGTRFEARVSVCGSTPHVEGDQRSLFTCREWEDRRLRMPDTYSAYFYLRNGGYGAAQHVVSRHAWSYCGMGYSYWSTLWVGTCHTAVHGVVEASRLLRCAGA